MPVDNASAVGTVFDIKQLAVYDGPGIRTTVFLNPVYWTHRIV